ncbi:SHOCT domain-containing protein [Pseudofrankia sp. BMG5.37]|uniref:SHOCT domain-containing protein n=1 Tax=Pseudofrankia sp. BMG5.37 TaxID=3050035 RepID=UPI002894D11D|nr:SHOCT domain-containing protein [Pseudofrankia sp. BMG5.37]MDT3439565.1 SHOCT domain-containing protein [Pseudofrankia sp. BMG5.37]
MSATHYLAYDYPVLGAFWTLFWIFLWVILLVLVFRVVVDIFRDREMSGWAKAGWLLFVLILPFIGIFAYLIARGKNMAERDARRSQEQRGMVNAYIREAAGGTNRDVDDLTRLSGLRASGDITAAEFQRAKEKILR